MRFDAEVVVKELIPALRSLLAEELHGSYGLTQEEIAARLEVTQPAVSQYLNGTRADPDTVEKLRKDPQIKLTVEDAASLAARDQEFLEEIRKAVKTVRDKGILKEKFSETRKL